MLPNSSRTGASPGNRGRRDYPLGVQPYLPGRWDNLVVICAGTSWDGPWSSEKHIADRMTQYGEVLYVDPPVSFRTAKSHPELAASVKRPHLRLVRHGLARFTPVVVPGMHRLGVPEVTEFLLRRLLHNAVARLTERASAVVVAGPADPFNVCGERMKVVYATDDWVAGADLMGLPPRQLLRAERRQASHANKVVAVSPLLLEKWQSLGHDPLLITNGCDSRIFRGTDQAPLPSDVELPKPIAGFVGHLSERIDLSLLEAVAARGISLLLVGPRQVTFDLERVERLFALPNVQWVGSQPFGSLPSYLRLMSVGLTPYSDNAFNRASFPLKTLEYLAAGRAAVATDLPAIRCLDTDLISVASSPSSFADAVEEAVREAPSESLVRRRQEFADIHSWEARTTDFAKAIGIVS